LAIDVKTTVAKALLACVLLALPRMLMAQTAPLPTSVCEVSAHPNTYSGRFVMLRARIIAGFEIFAIEDPSGKCARMWLEYAGGGPTAMMSMGRKTPPHSHAPVELKRDAEFDRFKELLKAEMYPRDRGTLCMGCNRYQVTATLTGRVDLATKGTGYGHLNAYDFQFELESVTDVVGKDMAGNYDSALFSATPVRFPTGHFKGTVRSPSGGRVQSIKVTATRTDDVPLYMKQVSKRTDDKGKFELDVPPGRYVLGVNTDVPVVAEFPFPPTYFPGTTDHSSATVLNVVDGQTIETDVNIPTELVRKDITTRVEWSDGKPAGDVQVWLKETRIPYGIAGTGSVTHTDAGGTTILPAFAGFAYTVHAETNVLHPHSYEHFCAQPIRIDATGTAREVVLKLDIKGEDVCRDLNR